MVGLVIMSVLTSIESPLEKIFLSIISTIATAFTGLFTTIFGSFGSSISTMFSVFSSSLGPYQVIAPIIWVASLGGAVIVGFGVFMIVGPEKDVTEAEDDL